MEFEDCSLWHHLIFCEELESDGNNQVVCWLCKELVLGSPTYKCLECNFLQHKSCTKPTKATKLKVKHYLRERHHLIIIEELDSNGKKEVVCLGCEKLAFGPAYKCSIPECNFLLHKSCAELPHVILHSVHSKHALTLRAPSIANSCNACQRYCNGSFFYRCSLCDFDLDIICAFHWQINTDDCHQHAFVSIRRPIQFTCEACGEESKAIAYLCSICRLLIDRDCILFPRTIKTSKHAHSLTCTYSLRQVKEQDNIFCRLCYKKMNTEYAAYYCQACGYIAHLNCAYRFKDRHQDSSATIESVANNSVDFVTGLVHLVEGINLAKDERDGPQEIKHFSHPEHNLILNNEELMEDKRCEACMQFIIFAPFYGCAQCNFFLHKRCAKLPTTINQRLFHKHPLILLSQAPSMGGLFWCHACRRHRHGFAYGCDDCGSYKFDVQCCLIPGTLKHEGHPHSIFLAIRYRENCNACGLKILAAFVCTNCRFTLCIRCATLPLVARNQYDTHLLTLTYTREDDSEEYYCLICEEERDPDHWFYYCVKCKFPAHRGCVVGENPCIKFGRIYTEKDHEHPLTIVQKTKHSPPCDACGKPFDNVALECTQCKFNIHPRASVKQHDCLQKLSKKRVK